MISRKILPLLEERLFKGRALVLYGARQVGKTTLVKELLSRYDGASVYLDCDEPDVRQGLEARTSTELKHFFGNARLVVIDEAQRVQDIGLTLKLAVDTMPDTQILATGSSSFELANRTCEPLTGRKFEFHLHPFSLGELSSVETAQETRRLLERRLVFGMYPAVTTAGGELAGEILRELAGSYLYKDILAWRDIRRPEILDKLVRALALQVGSEVSFTELGAMLGVDKHTVEAYLTVLEQAFIVFRLMPFSRNLRNELKKMRKVYFWDVGIRNALMSNLNPIGLRTDVGPLWENFAIVERIKALQNSRRDFAAYFWRTHQQQEIDYVEEREGRLLAAEIKWRSRRVDMPPAFTAAYPHASTAVVTPDTLATFVTL
ncbi:MAG: ATP-binding protein [Kiritimatiellae bacterium]|nr:ATP-binding protein [Kiritimatiellia bacterium]